ncbi:MAG: ATP-binding protein [Verrucomicrobiota bacterium]
MFGLGVYSWIAGGLQLIVPSYALRLVRRYGTQRTGWFLVTAFLSLALLHLLGPQKPARSILGSAASLELIYAVGSVLLLIGMGHMETVCSERDRARTRQASLQRELETKMQEETSFLTKTNHELTREIARRKEAQAELENAQAQYRYLFAENPQPMWILDLRSARFLTVNRAALRLYGFTEEEFLQMTGRDLLLPAALAGFVQDLAKPCAGAEARGIWRHCRKDGTLIDVEIVASDLMHEGVPARLVVASDVTRRRRRELQLRKLHKMEVIGQVAGGIAPHLNRVFARIESHTATLRDLPLNLKSAEEVEHITAAIHQAAALSHQLLVAGGKQLAACEPMDLNAFTRGLGPVFQNSLGSQVRLESAFASGLPPVHADPRLLEQVLVQLVRNAGQSIDGAGTITIGTARVQLDPEAADLDAEARPGEFVRLEIRDTGCGMTPQLQSHLFEPFFTTREPGQGIGLGLAGVYGAIKQMSGWIAIESHPGTGTECRVYLPCARVAAAASAAATTGHDGPPKAVVLLVEPDDRARAMARFVLNRHGYRVIEADSAETAQVLWNGQAGYIDLLVVNNSLPGELSGTDLAAMLVSSKPALRTLFTCESDAATPEDAGLLPKPFVPDTLVSAVQRALA